MLKTVITLTVLLSCIYSLAQAPTQGQQAPPTAAEQLEARKSGIHPKEIPAFVAWLRAGRKSPSVDIEALRTAVTQAATTFKTSVTPCQNGDFEQGNFSGWNFMNATTAYGSASWNYVSSPAIDSLLPHVAQHALIGPHLGAAWNSWSFGSLSGSINLNGVSWNNGSDPIVASGGGNLPVPFPGGGSQVLRLGNPGVDNPNDGEGANYPFVLSPTTQDFRFRYALVLEDGGHGSGNPAFAFIVWAPVGPFGSYQPIHNFNRIADLNNSFFNKGPSLWVWQRISCYSYKIPAVVNGVPLMGKTLIASFYTHDCLYQFHGGYAYIDSLCDPSVGKPKLSVPKSTICEGDPLIVDGSATSDERSYTWTMEQCSPSGVPILGTKVAETTNGEVGAAFDIGAWYRGKGKAMPCGRHYKVTLSITTECGADAISKIVFVDCCNVAGGSAGCCTDTPVKLTEPYIKLKPSTTYPNGFDTALGVTWPGGRKRVEVSIINVLRKTMPNGAVHRSFGFVRGAAPSITGPAMTPVLPNLLFPWIARWESSAPVSSGANAIFPITLQFSPPISNQTSFLRFTLLVRAYDADCRACEVQQTFSFKFTGQGWEPIKDSEWPKNVIGDPTGVISGLTIGEIKEAFGPAPKGAPRSGPGGAAKIDLSPFPPLDREMWPASVLNCCLNQLFRVSRTDPRAAQSSLLTGNWAFSPTITSSIAPAAKVEIAVMNAAAAAPMGQTYPTDVSLNNAQVVAAFAPPQYGALPFSHVVKWQSTGTSLAAGVNFPMMIQLPKPPVNGTIYVHFTVRYTIFTPECRPCDTYQLHFLKIDAGKAPVIISPKDWPIKIEGPPDNGPGSPNKRGGGGAIRERR